MAVEYCKVDDCRFYDGWRGCTQPGCKDVFEFGCTRGKFVTRALAALDGLGTLKVRSFSDETIVTVTVRGVGRVQVRGGSLGCAPLVWAYRRGEKEPCFEGRWTYETMREVVEQGISHIT